MVPAMNRAERIRTELQSFEPLHLQVDDESHQHGSAPGRESHFAVVLVASCFADLSEVQRHRAVYQKLGAEFDSGLHALALHLYSPEEWARHSGHTHRSPPCAHSDSAASTAS